MRFRGLLKIAILLLGMLPGFIPTPMSVAQAQSCQNCGWTEGTPWYTYWYNPEQYCAYYYQNIDYYYCGEYKYTSTSYAYTYCL